MITSSSARIWQAGELLGKRLLGPFGQVAQAPNDRSFSTAVSRTSRLAAASGRRRRRISELATAVAHACRRCPVSRASRSSTSLGQVGFSASRRRSWTELSPASAANTPAGGWAAPASATRADRSQPWATASSPSRMCASTTSAVVMRWRSQPTRCPRSRHRQPRPVRWPGCLRADRAGTVPSISDQSRRRATGGR
jgi:hypothetical protein